MPELTVDSPEYCMSRWNYEVHSHRNGLTIIDHFRRRDRIVFLFLIELKDPVPQCPSTESTTRQDTLVLQRLWIIRCISWRSLYRYQGIASGVRTIALGLFSYGTSALLTQRGDPPLFGILSKASSIKCADLVKCFVDLSLMFLLLSREHVMRRQCQRDCNTSYVQNHCFSGETKKIPDMLNKKLLLKLFDTFK
jgi:hypothetical protein